jgi:hypothetical protein
VLVVEKKNNVDLEELFGPDTEPGIPFYCVPIEDIGLQIDLTTKKELVASGPFQNQ